MQGSGMSKTKTGWILYSNTIIPNSTSYWLDTGTQTGDLPSCLKKEKPGNFLFKKNQQPYGSSLKCLLERYCFYILALHLGLTICAAPKSSRFTLELTQKSHFDVLLLLGGCDLKRGALQVMLAAQFAHAWENLCDYAWIQPSETKPDASG